MTNQINLYKKAVEEKWRFDSVRGPLSLEEVYDLPLTGNNGLNLDSVAIAIYNKIKANEQMTVSFVDETSKSSKENQRLEGQLELVKERIADVTARNKANEDMQAKAVEKAKIERLIAAKEQEALSNLDVDQLKEMLEKL